MNNITKINNYDKNHLLIKFLFISLNFFDFLSQYFDWYYNLSATKVK